jgi:GT2 family glycosyltransferase
VPTLAGNGVLADCLRSLELQTFQDFETVVVDNSGAGSARASGRRLRIIVNTHNVGFGAAVNQAIRDSQSDYLAALNDDAVADARWLETLVACADAHPRAGLFASEVHLADSGRLDSAGMLIALDGSAKQRGHGRAPEEFADACECLFPSGSAALYRRTMLGQTGLFDESFFLYCEDTDLGLRARWAGWECLYVPGAIVEHRYSHSAGRATPLKAYYVERNRLYTVIKNFPARLLWRAPLATAARYFWHLVSIVSGHGKAAEFRDSGYSAAMLPFLVLRAHASMLLRLPRLLRERRRVMRMRSTSAGEFARLLARHSISVREVASL